MAGCAPGSVTIDADPPAPTTPSQPRMLLRLHSVDSTTHVHSPLGGKGALPPTPLPLAASDADAQTAGGWLALARRSPPSPPSHLGAPVARPGQANTQTSAPGGSWAGGPVTEQKEKRRQAPPRWRAPAAPLGRGVPMSNPHAAVKNWALPRMLLTALNRFERVGLRPPAALLHASTGLAVWAASHVPPHTRTQD